MRVSDQQFSELSNLWVTRTRNAALESSERVQMSRRVVRPSDDPAASAAAVREAAAVRQAEARLASAREGRSLAEHAEGALDNVGTILQRLSELAIRAANDTLAPSDRVALAREVSALRDQLHSLANTNVKGAYVFAGYLDDRPAFDGAGTYVGGAEAREVEVAPAVRIDTGIPGDLAFAPAGGVDLFAATAALEAALTADDLDGVRVAIDDMRNGVAQVADARARLGAFIDSFRTSESVLERTRDESIARRGELVDAGLGEVFEYEQAQRALDAAIAVASRLPLTSLLDRG